MTNARGKDQFIMDECINFLDDLQYEVDKRDKVDFEFMVSDARRLSEFVMGMAEALKKIK